MDNSYEKELINKMYRNVSTFSFRSTADSLIGHHESILIDIYKSLTDNFVAVMANKNLFEQLQKNEKIHLTLNDCYITWSNYLCSIKSSTDLYSEVAGTLANEVNFEVNYIKDNNTVVSGVLILIYIDNMDGTGNYEIKIGYNQNELKFDMVDYFDGLTEIIDELPSDKESIKNNEIFINNALDVAYNVLDASSTILDIITNNISGKTNIDILNRTLLTFNLNDDEGEDDE